jgi:hypothetical protein
MRVTHETHIVVVDADGHDTSYRATLMPQRRHQASNAVSIASLGEAARALGGKVEYRCANLAYHRDGWRCQVCGTTEGEPEC